ncbi:MAG: methyltransferase domain-containing protein [Rhodospirillaceae bacterium]|jgi:predicted SAM-dependent methyltransferase|nr:methyltransferase domain-containing protein [Rhodospirillaceae bacterium]MBT7954024.1 methyltransferase domain-containing protein [Rhodospirillaceae bacterium]
MKLHIGGLQQKDGWSILNILAGPEVDYTGSCTDLSQFPNNSIEEIYASHVFEHLGHRDELPQALAECYRVLAAGGQLKISVPDLKVLATFFAQSELSVNQRYELMLMMFGGQQDEFDFHKVGMFEELLTKYLNHAGFERIQKVEEFNLFDDSSLMRLGDVLISLNLIASK